MYRIPTNFALGLAGLVLLFLTPPLVSQEPSTSGAVLPTYSRPAYMRVLLPAGAELLVDGTRTRQKSADRLFESPPLPQGKRFIYTLKATWKENGKEVVRERVVRVEAGKETPVDLREEPITKEDKALDTAPKAPEKSPDITPKPEDKTSTPKAEDKTPSSKPKAEDKTPVSTPKAEDKTPSPKPKPADKPTEDTEPKKTTTDVIFWPTPQEVVDKMLELAKVKKGDLVYDLGCGDGRIVVTAAKKYGVEAVGFDIDPERIKDSLDNVKKNKVEKLVTIKRADIFSKEFDFKEATVVTLYLLPDLNVKLMPKLEKLKPGSRIVSHDFDMAGAKPNEKVEVKVKDDKGIEREHTVYLWVVPWEKEK